MLEHRLSSIIFLIGFFLCLSMSHAQTNPTTVLTNTLGSIQPTPPPAGDPLLDPNAPSLVDLSGKYEEHQSICRQNEYDLPKYYSEELKKKRVDLLLNKLAKPGSEEIKIKFRLAKEYLDQGQSNNARELLQGLKEKKLSNYDNDFLNALLALSDNKVSEARGILNKLSLDEKNTKNIELLRILAETYTAEKNYYEASTLYEDLNTLYKNNFLVQLCEVTVLNTMNAEGEKVCLRAAQVFSESPFPPIFIGIAHRERLDLKKAESYFRKSLKVKATEMASTCLAEIHYIGEKYEFAAKEFERAASINPRSIRALLGRAWSDLKAKNYDASLAAFKLACKQNGRYEIELRKAFKSLSADKIPQANQFIQAANLCGGGSIK